MPPAPEGGSNDGSTIFGYSMGGYVGMYLAKNHSNRIEKLITLATKFKWNKIIAEKEINHLNAETIAEKLPEFAAALKNSHAPNDWKKVFGKTADMLMEMGNANPLKPGDFYSIKQPVMLMLGDRDKMVKLDETLEVYKLLPLARLSIFPNTPHPIEKVSMLRLAFEIKTFLQ